MVKNPLGREGLSALNKNTVKKKLFGVSLRFSSSWNENRLFTTKFRQLYAIPRQIAREFVYYELPHKKCYRGTD
jgi:hypothetical protein